ncbi:hypothetical protein GF322_03450 [Candidatus Dependentiae bacterium]|nr:hypothetical protein [Candidatus Dependentiae bacterium]
MFKFIRFFLLGLFVLFVEFISAEKISLGLFIEEMEIFSLYKLTGEDLKKLNIQKNTLVIAVYSQIGKNEKEILEGIVSFERDDNNFYLINNLVNKKNILINSIFAIFKLEDVQAPKIFIPRDTKFIDFNDFILLGIKPKNINENFNDFSTNNWIMLDSDYLQSLRSNSNQININFVENQSSSNLYKLQCCFFRSSEIQHKVALYFLKTQNLKLLGFDESLH